MNARTFTVVGLLASLSIASGCGSPLAGGNEMSIRLDTEPATRTPGALSTLAIHFSTERDCRTLSEDFRATQNGEPLRVMERGYWDPGGIYMDPPFCAYPLVEVRLPDPSEASTTFVLSDSGEEIVAEFLQLTTPITAEIREPADRVLRRGQQVVLAYAPVTTVVDQPTIRLTVRDGAFPWSATVPVQVNPQTATLTFTAPALAPVGTLEVLFGGSGRAGTGRCTAKECVGRKPIDVQLSAPLAAQ